MSDIIMTEDEAIKEFKENIELPFGCSISNKASEIAISALEELEQYRAIGTVKEIKEMLQIVSEGQGVTKALNKLAKYEELDEQGKLLRLPCVVGDTVYEICEGFIEPCTVEVIFLADYKDKDGNPSYMMEIHYDREDCPQVLAEIYFTDIGKTVFLTKKEAENALQGMG